MTRCQVTFLHLYRCARWPNILKLNEWRKATWPYDLHISEYSYLWSKVRSFLLPLHYQAIGEKPNPSFTHHFIFYFIMHWDMLGYCWWFRCKFWSVTFIDVIWGHMTLFEVINRFRLITHHWKEQHVWARSHCACFVPTHRLICNMSYFGQHLTSGDLNLRLNIDLTRLRSPCIWFDAPWRKEHDGTRIKPLAFLVQRPFAEKNVFCKNSYFGMLIPRAQTAYVS